MEIKWLEKEINFIFTNKKLTIEFDDEWDKKCEFTNYDDDVMTIPYKDQFFLCSLPNLFMRSIFINPVQKIIKENDSGKIKMIRSKDENYHVLSNNINKVYDRDFNFIRKFNILPIFYGKYWFDGENNYHIYSKYPNREHLIYDRNGNLIKGWMKKTEKIYFYISDYKIVYGEDRKTCFIKLWNEEVSKINVLLDEDEEILLFTNLSENNILHYFFVTNKNIISNGIKLPFPMNMRNVNFTSFFVSRNTVNNEIVKSLHLYNNSDVEGNIFLDDLNINVFILKGGIENYFVSHNDNNLSYLVKEDIIEVLPNRYCF